jgi:hypothetical protein
LTSFSRRLVSDHGSAVFGIASVRMKFARLYAGAWSWRRTALAGEGIGYLLKPDRATAARGTALLRQAFLSGAELEQAASRRVAKVEWHPGELYPRVGFIVSNLARSAEGIVAFYNQRGTCERKEVE